MGAIGGLLGTAGGVNGSGISGPDQANIQTPITSDMVTGANAQTGNTMADQQKLLAALQSSGGLKDQQAASSQLNNINNNVGQLNGIGNSQNAMAQQQGLNNSLNNANGVGVQTGAVGQQQQLNSQLAGANGVGTQQAGVAGLQSTLAQQRATAGQYQDIANGVGPNPAQAALNQSTGQNIAAQAALMAGQRGAGANTGLIARQAAQQGAATQQQAVGQSATLQAQQQINALSGLSAQQAAQGTTSSALGSLGSAQVGAQQAGIGAQSSQGQALAGQQQAGIGAQQNAAGQQIAQQQAAAQAAAAQANSVVGQQIGQTNTNTSNAIGQQSNLISGIGNQNNAAVGSTGNVNSANAALANTNSQGQQALIGGALNSLGGSSMMSSGKAHGGMVSFAEGGEAAPASSPTADYLAGKSATDQYLAPPAPTPMQPAPPLPPAPVPPMAGPQSGFGQLAAEPSPVKNAEVAPPQNSALPMPSSTTMGYGSQALQQGVSKFVGAVPDMAKSMMSSIGSMGGEGGGGGAMALAALARGGMVPARLSQGEDIIPPGATPAQAAAKVVADKATGGTVQPKAPGQEAVKKGNSYANDKIPAKVQAGSIVIPRSVMQAKDPAEAARAFVAKVLAKKVKK